MPVLNFVLNKSVIFGLNSGFMNNSGQGIEPKKLKTDLRMNYFIQKGRNPFFPDGFFELLLNTYRTSGIS